MAVPFYDNGDKDDRAETVEIEVGRVERCAMAEPVTVSLLMLDFLTWIASRPRTYAEAMEAWRSNCPRHTVWEDALLDGLIQIDSGDTLHQSAITLTLRGRALLDGNH
jgi:hypothetical protein